MKKFIQIILLILAVQTLVAQPFKFSLAPASPIKIDLTDFTQNDNITVKIKSNVIITPDRKHLLAVTSVMLSDTSSKIISSNIQEDTIFDLKDIDRYISKIKNNKISTSFKLSENANTCNAWIYIKQKDNKLEAWIVYKKLKIKTEKRLSVEPLVIDFSLLDPKLQTNSYKYYLDNNSVILFRMHDFNPLVYNYDISLSRHEYFGMDKREKIEPKELKDVYKWTISQQYLSVEMPTLSIKIEENKDINKELVKKAMEFASGEIELIATANPATKEYYLLEILDQVDSALVRINSNILLTKLILQEATRNLPLSSIQHIIDSLILKFNKDKRYFNNINLNNRQDLYNSLLAQYKYDLNYLKGKLDKFNTAYYKIYSGEQKINSAFEALNKEIIKIKDKVNSFEFQSKYFEIAELLSYLNKQNWTITLQETFIDGGYDKLKVNFSFEPRDGFNYQSYNYNFEFFFVNRWKIDMSSGVNFITRKIDTTLLWRPTLGYNLNIYYITKHPASLGLLFGISTDTENMFYNMGIGVHVGREQRFGISSGVILADFVGHSVWYPYFGIFYNLKDIYNIFKNNQK